MGVHQTMDPSVYVIRPKIKGGIDMVWGFVIVFFLFFILWMTYGAVQNRRKSAEISELKSKLAQQKPAEDPNELKMYDTNILPCTMDVVDMDGSAPPDLQDIKGWMEHLDLKGLRFTCQLDVPARKDIRIRVHFALHDEDYSIDGTLLRKEEYLRSQQLAYGIAFRDMDVETYRTLREGLHRTSQRH